MEEGQGHSGIQFFAPIIWLSSTTAAPSGRVSDAVQHLFHWLAANGLHVLVVLEQNSQSVVDHGRFQLFLTQGH